MNAFRKIGIASINFGRRIGLGPEILRGSSSPTRHRREAGARSFLFVCLVGGSVALPSGVDAKAGFIQEAFREFKWAKETREGVRGKNQHGKDVIVQAKFLLQNGQTFESQPVFTKEDGNFRVPVPKDVAPKSTVVFIDDVGESTTYTLAAQLFNPPGNMVVASHTVVAGSTATFAGETFALSGGFIAVDTDLDDDPSSPNYGNVSAYVSASGFNVVGTGSLGVFTLALEADQPYSLNLLPAWDAEDTGISIPINLSLSGIATLGSIVSPVSGSAIGTITFLDDGVEHVTLELSLTSNLGPITGTLNTVGVEQIIPEPSSVVMLGAGILGVLGSTWYRRALAAREWPPPSER